MAICKLAVGVLLDYPDRKVYYFNSIANVSVKGINATYAQVVTGIIAALLTLMHDKLEKGVHFVEDLNDSYHESYVFDSSLLVFVENPPIINTPKELPQQSPGNTH